MTFSKLGLNEHILKAIKEQGYTEPTPIQAQAIPIILQKKDILISINDSDPSYNNLYKTFARSKPGDVIKLNIQRKQEFLELVFTAKMAD